MSKNWVRPIRPENSELENRLETAKNALSASQMAIKEKRLPVLVVLDGFGAAGKGSVLSKLITCLDPRFFKVETLARPSEDEQRRPFLYRYFTRIPEAGTFSFFDGSWMDDVVYDYAEGHDSKEAYKRHIESIQLFERQLSDNGYLVVKFFFHISKKVQKKRLQKLLSNKDTSWRVTKKDLEQNKNYEEYTRIFDSYIDATNQFAAPWYYVDARDRKWALLQMLEILVNNINTALSNIGRPAPILQNRFRMSQVTPLKDIPLDKTIEPDAYRKQLKELQGELSELHNRLYRKKVPVVIAYEGWDAAGKGGNIKRITAALDPRGYEVHPIASPEPHEKARHYLWRFFNRLPKDGHIAIFDRTWYGRVMVERLEGFCSEYDWQRAYNEINEFENELFDWGACIIKFWVQIDKDTQLERFTDRQNTPGKQWKITDEDWRNREKWELYETAVDEMIEKTSTDFAPWHILESNDKKYARIKALETVIREIRKRL